MMLSEQNCSLVREGDTLIYTVQFTEHLCVHLENKISSLVHLLTTRLQPSISLAKVDSAPTLLIHASFFLVVLLFFLQLTQQVFSN